jgi:hypothetical protein
MHCRTVSRFAPLACCVAFAVCSAPSAPARAADEPVVLGVVACDPYADLKKQIGWVGGLVDQPGLAALAETPLMMATQFKGLAGLDVTRPLGVVVTAEGPAEAPVMRGFVPVKDLGKLLDSLAPVIGPVEEQNGVKTITPAGMPPLQIVEKAGWAIISPQGSPAAPAGLEELLDPIVKSFSLGIQLFPARLPEGLRAQLQAMLGQAAAMQGQAVDADAVAAQLATTESFLLGVNIDIEKERVFVENRTAMTEQSADGKLFGEMAQATLTMPAPATADGKPAAVSGHAALAIPAAFRKQALDMVQGLDAAGLPGLAIIPAILRNVLPAMLDTDAVDASLTIDTAASKAEPGKAMPAITACMKVKDGRALEAALKKAFAAKDALPEGVAVKFDTGKAGAATLHVVELDVPNVEAAMAQAIGEKVAITLGVSPDRAVVALGADAEKRITGLAAGGDASPNAKPFAGLDLSLVPLLRWVAQVRSMDNAGADDVTAAVLEAIEKATNLPSTSLQLLLRPIDRGMASRLSADAGAIRLLKDVFTVTSRPQVIGRPPRPIDPKGRRPVIPLPELAP